MGNGLRQEDPLRRLLEQDAVITTINRLFRAVDERDWELLAACFAPSVSLDLTSLAGGEPERKTSAEIAAEWEEALSDLDAIHHQAGNYEVDVYGQRARAKCNGIAFHYMSEDAGPRVRRFVGSYDLRLHKRRGSWCVDAFRYNVRFVDGNFDGAD